MHADHYLDIVGLRYLYPWGEPAPDPCRSTSRPAAVRGSMRCPKAVSERDGFFDAAFDAASTSPTASCRSASCACAFVKGRHYVPAWGVVIEAPDGARLAYTGDTGPSASVEEACPRRRSAAGRERPRSGRP